MKSLRENLNNTLKVALIIFALVIIQVVSVHAGCSSSLTNYWKLDESSGTTFTDSVGGASAVCGSPGCPSSTTYINNALLFDGTDDARSVSPQTSFNWGGTDSFSIEFWMKTDSASNCAGNQVVVGRSDASTSLHWWVGCIEGGKVAFELSPISGSGGFVSGEKDIANGSWHHIVAMRDGSGNKIRLYVDGVEDTDPYSITYSSGFTSATASLNIGWLNDSPYYHFQGTIDELAFHNRVLSDVEIKSHYFLARGYCDMHADPFSIMPLGDSLTTGYNDSMQDNNYLIGYRQKLYGDLISGGYDIDFVGSLSSGISALPAFDINHEGHGGWCADGCLPPYGDIKDNVYDFLVNNPADVVLLHIGTNDIDNGVQNPVAVGGILDEIDRYNQKVTVILARIVSRTDGKADLTTAFNDSVYAIALDRIANGDKIIWVDMESALTYPDDLDDPLHPNQTGYNKMAVVWYNALQTFLPLPTTLTVQKNGTGQGTVTSNPSGIDCGSTCNASIPQEKIVNLTATASSGSNFTSWTGCDSVNGNVCTVTMTSDKSVTAEFETSNGILYANFTEYNGLWQWSGSAWTQLTGAHPTSMVTSNGILYADFTEYNGLWPWSGSAWTQLTGAHPTSMVTSF